MELQTGHIGKGCDRDSYSDRSVRRLCGKSAYLSSCCFKNTFLLSILISSMSRLAVRIDI